MADGDGDTFDFISKTRKFIVTVTLTSVTVYKILKSSFWDKK